MKEKTDGNAFGPAPLVPHINVTPLIDVLLVLLIIFMVITPLRPSRFRALVPQPPDSADEIQPHPDALVVNINQDLTLRLNRSHEDVGSVNDTAKLSAALTAIFAQREAHARELFPTRALVVGAAAEGRVPKTVMIAAPRFISYGEVAKVIDGVKGAGAAPIGLQIDQLTP
ncbi:MAG: biopolymer transporter ExbD [Pyrinomonadaceae bacterium]